MFTARVFWSGRTHAVRLPKELRLDVDEVRIRRQGAALVLEPVVADRDWLDALSGGADADFSAAVNEPVPQQSRERLDRIFR